ncbi:hypothetical protein ACLOJK_016706 [Asimina triloba]
MLGFFHRRTLSPPAEAKKIDTGRRSRRTRLSPAASHIVGILSRAGMFEESVQLGLIWRAGRDRDDVRRP